MKHKLLNKLLTLTLLILGGAFLSPVWGEDVVKSEAFNFTTAGCSGWTTDNASSYCGGYGSKKNGGYYVANSSISNFSSVNFSSVTNPSVVIYVKALTNSGTNEYTVSLINNSGDVVGTPVTKTGGMGSGSNAASAKESSVTLTPVAGATGYRIDFLVKSAITQTRYELTYTTGGGGTNTYSVTYNANGATSGSVPTDATAYSPNATVKVLGNTGGLAKTGYAFGGWNTQADGSGTDRAAESTFNITENTTLYAKWTPYTITAQSNNNNYGTVSLEGYVITGSPAPGHRYADPAYSVTSGSASVAQEGDEFTVTPTSDCTVTINFEAIPTYTVTLSDDTENPITEITPGAGVTLPSRSAIGSYTFAGWSETNVSEETTTAPTIIPADNYAPTANITLYPVYTKTIGGGGTSHEKTSVTISEYAKTNDWGSSSSANQKNITLNSDVTAICNSGTHSGKYYNDGWRIYQTESGKVTVSSKSGELTSVTFTFTNSNNGTLNYNSSAITSGTAVDVSGTSAEFTVGNSGSATNGQVRISAISVNYDVTGAGTTYYWSAPVAATVEMPNIVVAENPFLFSTTATITCATEGAAIKYSYDGETWNDYEEPLVITEAKTIYAKAIKDENESSVAQVTATKNLATPIVTVNGDITLDLDGETDVEAGTLSATVTYNNAAVDGATVTWTSNNTDIAEINETSGVVIIKTRGTVTFTATYAGNTDYAETSGTKTVTVTDSKAPGSASNPYTVVEIEAQADATTFGNDIYVTGYIVGSIKDNKCYKTTTTNLVNTNLLLADEPNISFTEGASINSNTDGLIPIELPNNGTIRSDWGIDTNNYLIGYKIILKGNAQAYFSTKGIKGTSEITAVSAPAVVSTSSYATFAANADLDFTNSSIKAYIATANSTTGITFTQVNKVPAGTGVLLYKDGGTTEEIPVTAESIDEIENNVFVRGTGATVASVDSENSNLHNYILNKVNNVVGFYKANDKVVAKNRAYIQIDESVWDSSSAKDYISMPGFEDNTTGVNEVNGSGLMVNGPVYDLQGRRIEKPVKGLYIVNGKKILKY